MPSGLSARPAGHQRGRTSPRGGTWAPAWSTVRQWLPWMARAAAPLTRHSRRRPARRCSARAPRACNLHCIKSYNEGKVCKSLVTWTFSCCGMDVVKEFGSPSAWSVVAEYDFRALAFCKHISASLECERLEYKFARPCQISNSVTPSSSP